MSLAHSIERGALKRVRPWIGVPRRIHGFPGVRWTFELTDGRWRLLNPADIDPYHQRFSDRVAQDILERVLSHTGKIPYTDKAVGA